MSYEDKLESFAIELFKINGIKFGEYKTKVGLMTPVYCDLRVIISYPKLMVSTQKIVFFIIIINETSYVHLFLLT